MKKLLLLLFGLMSCSGIFANIITVGSGQNYDYYSIQSAIQASNTADTVLVYPGTYLECINFMGKAISLTSLKLTTGSDEYISNTVIDGNYQSSVVSFLSGETHDSKLIGFTITHGIGTQDPLNGHESIEGGGILCRNSSPSIIDCIITDNEAGRGAGMFLRDTSTYLSGNVIKFNKAFDVCGGLYSSVQVQMDNVNKNSIYGNVSGSANDILLNDTESVSTIYLDTFSVQSPESFFAYPADRLIIHAENYYISELDTDLYVSPSGSDLNDGLSPDTPFQTIAHAMIMLKSDSLDVNTIHLAPGTYSASLNQQFFPINCKKSFHLKGDNKNSTILDAEGAHSVILSWQDLDQVKLSHFSVTNTYTQLGDISSGPVNFFKNSDRIDMDSLNFYNNHSYGYSAFVVGNPKKSLLSNIDMFNNRGSWTASIFQANVDSSNVTLANSTFKSNRYQLIDTQSRGFIPLTNVSNYSEDRNNRFNVINTEFSGNWGNHSDFPPNTHAISISDYAYVNLINCTIADNHNYDTDMASAVTVTISSRIDVFNSIIYGNDWYQLMVYHPFSYPFEEINISHSLIQPHEMGWNGHGVYDCFDMGAVNWLEGNLEVNPLFRGTGLFPYQLRSDSPCIDAGTLNIPEGIILPETDLAGNPRIRGASIDMGAYEYQDSLAINPDIIISDQNKLMIYPNPFSIKNNKSSNKINLSISLHEAGDFSLEIFNIKGQKVKSLANAFSEKGDKNLFWNADNDQNHPLPAGIYFCKLKINGKTLTRKITIIK